MATLYKRATKEQQLMLRMVAGAVRNTAHAHGVELPKNFARSVAKRAVGTLCSSPAIALAVMQALAPAQAGGHEGNG